MGQHVVIFFFKWRNANVKGKPIISLKYLIINKRSDFIHFSRSLAISLMTIVEFERKRYVRWKVLLNIMLTLQTCHVCFLDQRSKPDCVLELDMESRLCSQV